MNKKATSSKIVKCLYSYGGKIVPRPIDGQLRYAGGFTRVLAVDRSVSYSDLLLKFGESCGSPMIMKCKLPTEDLDVLVSIKSDEELRSVVEEYERVSPESKIRVILFPMKPVKKVSQPSSPLFPMKPEKKVSQPSSPISCFDFPSVSKSYMNVKAAYAPRYQTAAQCAAVHRRAVGYPVAAAAEKHLCYDARSSRHLYNAAHRILTH